MIGTRFYGFTVVLSEIRERVDSTVATVKGLTSPHYVNVLYIKFKRLLSYITTFLTLNIQRHG